MADAVLDVVTIGIALGIMLVLFGFPLFLIYRTWKAKNPTELQGALAVLSMCIFALVGVVYIIAGGSMAGMMGGTSGGLFGMAVTAAFLLCGAAITLGSVYVLYLRVRTWIK